MYYDNRLRGMSEWYNPFTWGAELLGPPVRTPPTPAPAIFSMLDPKTGVSTPVTRDQISTFTAPVSYGYSPGILGPDAPVPVADQGMVQQALNIQHVHKPIYTGGPVDDEGAASAQTAPFTAKSLLLSPEQLKAYFGTSTVPAPSALITAAESPKESFERRVAAGTVTPFKPPGETCTGPSCSGASSSGLPWWALAAGTVGAAGATFGATKLVKNKKTGKTSRVPVNKFGQPMIQQSSGGGIGTTLAIGAMALLVIGLGGYAVLGKKGGSGVLRKRSKSSRRFRRSR